MTRRNRWPMLHILLTAHGTFLLFLWAAFAVISALITVGIATFDSVDTSVWHYMGTQLSRWFMLGLGMDAVTTYLRLNIAHGRTRADFLRQLWPHVVVLSIVSGLFVAIGYLVERGGYAIAGWPQQLPDGMVFNTANDFATAAGAYTVVFLLWMVVGVLLTAAFNRNFLLGLVTVPLALLIVVPGEILMTVNGIPVLGTLTSQIALPVLATLCAAVLTAGLGVLTTWGVTRDLPLRPRVA